MSSVFSENTEVGIQERTLEKGILGNSSNPEARFVDSHEQLGDYVEALKKLNLSIVLTSGTFDMTHIGHARYLEKAKEFGDILIVGVDSDAKVRARKGPDRPIYPEEERVNMLAHLRSVNIITLKQPDEPRWELIRSIRPDTLVVTEETYDEETLQELAKLCGQVVCLEPQATTSTSATLRKLHIDWSSKIIKPVEEILEEHQVSGEVRRKIGRVLMRQRGE